MLLDDFQPAAGLGFGFGRGNRGWDDAGDAAVGILGRVVALVLLAFVKLPIGVEVTAFARGRKRRTASAPVRLQRAPERFIWLSTR